MTALLDISGKRFGRLLAVRYMGDSTWLFSCDCGTHKTIRSKDVRNGKINSCGCIRRETTGAKRRTHGLRQIPEYKIWLRMKQRCHNERCGDFKYYGARGIGVCEEWRNSFLAFYRDMGPRPAPHLTVERVDNNAGYSPDNCVWATRLEQMQNTRKSSVKRE